MSMTSHSRDNSRVAAAPYQRGPFTRRTRLAKLISSQAEIRPRRGAVNPKGGRGKVGGHSVSLRHNKIQPSIRMFPGVPRGRKCDLSVRGSGTLLEVCTHITPLTVLTRRPRDTSSIFPELPVYRDFQVVRSIWLQTTAPSRGA